MNDTKFPQMDWQQVALNGGPPCFARLDEEKGWFCGRAERWQGHDYDHKFISLEQFLQQAIADERRRSVEIVNRFSICPDHDQPSHCVECDLRHKAIGAIRRDDTGEEGSCAD